MKRQVLSTPTFDRVAKKLYAKDKKTLDEVVQKIAQDKTVGEPKKGDLLGVSVYKFKMNKQEMLLSYTGDPGRITLLALGTHENFYRALTRKL